MSATTDEAAIAEDPPETNMVEGEPVANERKPKRAKAPKEEKPKSPKPSTPAHPPYFQMIKDAILALNEKTGSSPYAIAKHMEEKHKEVLPGNYKKMLAMQLRNFARKGRLVRVKNSFKLADPGKKKKKKSEGRAAAATKRKMKTVSSLKSSKMGRPKRAKKAVKPKQPKSVKSPATKKARKASASA